MNVIDSNKLEHDVVRKPLRTFRHHAPLRAVVSHAKGIETGALPITFTMTTIYARNRYRSLKAIDKSPA